MKMTRELSENTENGKTTKEYSPKIIGFTGFEVKGENVISTKYSAQNEEFWVRDMDKYNEILNNGEFDAAKIVLDGATGDNCFEKLRELWNSGKLNFYKEKYFKNISTNLDDYQLSVGENGVTPCICDFNGESVAVGAGQIIVKISYKFSFPIIITFLILFLFQIKKVVINMRK